jgi:hypothetical protein
VSDPATETRFGPTGPCPVSKQQTQRWVDKACDLARPLVELAGAVGDAAPVAPMMVEDPREWAFGNFMLAWLDAAGEVRHVRHLPDASFFLRLLGRAYAPVFEKRPDLADLLLDDSRPEMSLTNDALQIQLRSADPGEGYSMIRNHALMLFIAALWLDEPQRGQWLDLYDQLVTYVDGRPEGRPDLQALSACESGAFADFVELAPLTLDPATADELLASDDALARILDYQLYAGVAIGLLWREYRTVADDDREQWYRTQLSELYVRPDYLNDTWMGLR